MKYVVLAIAIALQLACLSLPAQAAGVRVNAFDRVFGPVHCSVRGVCIVKFNGGGVIDDFKAAVSAVNRSSLQVVIAGPCYSACTIFADKARTHVCITPSAEFGFHKAHVDGHVDWNDPLPGNSGDIVKWVNKHGGYPDDIPLIMSYKDALQNRFWKRCA